MNKALFDAVKSAHEKQQATQAFITDADESSVVPSSSKLQRMTSFRQKDPNDTIMMRAKIAKQRMIRATHKTAIIIRARNTMLCADKVRARCIPERVIGIPKTVKLHHLRVSVVDHMQFDTPKERARFLALFTEAPAVDAIIKDMFWTVVCAYFQQGEEPQVELGLYTRVALNYTKVLMQHNSSSSSGSSSSGIAIAIASNSTLDRLPDALAQVVFLSLHDAFPNSRREMNDTLKKWILERCYSWLLGFIPPGKLSWTHWLPEITIKAPRKVVAMTEFPATKHRMERAERLEKIKLDQIRKHREHVLHEKKVGREHDRALTSEMPQVPLQLAMHERTVYELDHSLLVQQFLKLNATSAPPTSLKTKIRLTNDKTHPLEQHVALRPCGGTTERKVRILDAKSYRALINQFERYNKHVSNAHHRVVAKNNEQQRVSLQELTSATHALENKHKDLMTSDLSIHELSNILVCKRQVEDEKRRHEALLHPYSGKGKEKGERSSVSSASSASGFSGIAATATATATAAFPVPQPPSSSSSSQHHQSPAKSPSRTRAARLTSSNE